MGAPSSAPRVPDSDYHDTALVAWLASRAYEMRAGASDRVKSPSGDDGEVSVSPFEAVDAVFEEIASHQALVMKRLVISQYSTFGA
jgi:hypothetical protein